MAYRCGRAASQAKILIRGIFEQWIAEDRSASVDRVDFHAIRKVSTAFDWGIDCVGAVN